MGTSPPPGASSSPWGRKFGERRADPHFVWPWLRPGGAGFPLRLVAPVYRSAARRPRICAAGVALGDCTADRGRA
eukprot:51610-Pyramimonas_sp.AAC.1